jgi:hypothetical protein
VLAFYTSCRWQEAALVSHSVGRTLSTLPASLNVFSGPPTFVPFCKYRMHLWTEALLYPFTEPVG